MAAEGRGVKVMMIAGWGSFNHVQLGTMELSLMLPNLELKQTVCSDPGGGLDKHTDRDQRSWVFDNYPKNTLPLTERPKNTFRKENPKKYPPKSSFIWQKLSTI